MKKHFINALVFLALGTMVISCSKEEAEIASTANNVSEVKATKPVYTIPLDYRPGQKGDNQLTTPVPQQIPAPDSGFPPNEPFKEISTVTPQYIKETCAFTFSHLENNGRYSWIRNKKMAINFGDITANSFTEFSRLTPGQGVYWAPVWGESPAVQEKHPEVLFTSENEWVVIVLGKPCTEFGFEIAPNEQNRDMGFYASFGNSTEDASAGSVRQTARTPNGAKLLAIKSTKPFTHITIGTLNNGPAYSEQGGFAIANLRYKLAK
jgi:hypothetical protein